MGSKSGGGGGQFTANQGSEWMGSHHDAKEGFQVSRRGVQKQGWGFPGKGGKRGYQSIGLYAPIMLILYIPC
jgi:hypothetical protein